MHIPSYPPVWWILGMSALIWLCSSKVSIHRCCLLCVCICVFVFSLDHHTFNSIHYTRIYCMNLSSNIKPSKLANQIIPLKNVKCSVCNVVLNCVNSFVVVCETDQTRATATVFSFVSLLVNIHLFLCIKLSIVYLNRHSVHFGFLFDVWMHWNFCFSWSSVLGPQKYRSAHCFHCLFIFCFFATAKTATATVLNGWVEKYTSSFPANKFCHLFIVLLYVVRFVHSIMAFFIDTASKSRTLLSVSLSLKSIVKATNERTFLREQRWSTENGHRYAQPGNLIRENVPKAVPLSLSLGTCIVR